MAAQPKKRAFSSVTKWPDALSEVEINDVAKVADFTDILQVDLDERLVDTVLFHWIEMYEHFS